MGYMGYIMKRFAVFGIVMTVMLASCSKFLDKDDDESNPFQGVAAKTLYTDSQKAMEKKEYTAATKRLEALETMYPFSDYSERAAIDLIYAYYEKEEYAACAAAAERFIHLYPRAKNVDYAYYMKALANFQQPRGAMAKFLPLDESWRDPGTQAQSYSDFATLVQLFPNSKYKANSLQRMIYLRNMFAQKNLNIAKYYYHRKMFVAASERANYVIKTYPQASSTQEAMALLYNANKELGLNDAAKDTLQVYEATYNQQPPAEVAASA